ncbi:colicin transporter [Parasedimentitalea marina]|uniref:Colicin transporter n=1 Tax=Parasedimentitalea marina TaxID=2483033 RepID=A0A3T0N273_9RHOB|nr:colicin transporter [Parasedimentitalea marina]AZV78123.1 colicin transporter [Parasedimentitalea marina]
MSQIEELQSRITAAMDRIGTGLGALEAAKDEAAQNDLTQALEDERLANAQLEERLKTLKAQLADVPAPVDTSGDLEALQAEVELLRNEVGNTVEKDALKEEVARLTSELEAAGNTAAMQAEGKASLEAEVAEVRAEVTALQDQIATAADGGGDETPTAELTAEVDSLKAQLEAAQGALDEAQAASGQPELAPASDNSEELERQNGMLVQLDTDLQQLRHANESLRSANTALREANAAGVGDAGLINSALEAEIEGLRAAQASDQAQVNVVLAKLEPLLAQAQNLPEGEEV